MTEIAMPRLSDSMEQGTILTWLKADGELVARDEDLVEIETDKATMTYPSPEEGVLAIIASEGSSLPVGAPIASLATRAAAQKQSTSPEAAAAPASAQASGEAAANGSAHDGDRGSHESAVRATPVARRLARIHGVELSSLRGSGPRGRVTRRDVAAAAGLAMPSPAAPAPRVAASPDGFQPAAPSEAAERDGAAPHDRAALPGFATPADRHAQNGAPVRELTRLQQVVARRMAQAQVTVPDFQVETEVAMDAALLLRSHLKAAAAAEEIVPSINDMIVKASALALRRHPLANGSYVEGGFQLHDEVNVGIAVAADRALVVPTITAADVRSLGSIAGEARRLSERVRSGTVTPAELSGATFTVSNLGMFGMTAITPVVNMPQAAILGVGSVRAVLARDERGEVVDRSLMTLRLSCDHRILYGADAARFLADVRALLEAPMRLSL